MYSYEIRAAILETSWDAIESARDYVDEEMLEQLLPMYETLTWLQKVAFASVVQDLDDARLRPIMLDVLRAPLDKQRDIVECTKAMALGFVDEEHDRFQHYYDDREALHAAVAEVLGDDAPPIPAEPRDAAALARSDDPPLLDACVNGQRELALSWIDRGADVKATRVADQTALFWAACHAWPDVTRALIARGALVDAADSYGGTPLHEAVKSSAEVTRILLEAGANPRARYDDGRTPVWFAAHAGHVDVVRELLAAGVAVDERHADTTMLAIACRENHADLVAELLARGASVDVVCSDFEERRTPLMIAARYGFPRIVRALLAAGADRSIAIDGTRAIDLATGKRSDEIRALLQ